MSRYTGSYGCRQQSRRRHHTRLDYSILQGPRRNAERLEQRSKADRRTMGPLERRACGERLRSAACGSMIRWLIAFERPRSRHRSEWCSSMAIAVLTAIASLHKQERWPEQCSERAPSGSVVSFMLPNWHEAAVIYMAATLAGMVGESDPAFAARSRAAVHIEGRREPPRVCAVGSAPARLCGDDEPRNRSNGIAAGSLRGAGRCRKPHALRVPPPSP